MANAYDQIAELYAEAFGPFFLSRYERLLEEKLLPSLSGNRVLELGCGSGDVAAWLQDRGCSVVGLDASAQLIQIAQARYRGPEFHVGDITRLKYRDEFAGATCLFDTLNHLQQGEVVACFRGAHRALMNGGIFLLDVNTPAAFIDRWSGTQVLSTAGKNWIVRPSFEATSGVGEFRIESGNLSATIREKPYKVAQVSRWLSNCGFQDVQAWDATLYAPRDVGRAFFLARKRGDAR